MKTLNLMKVLFLAVVLGFAHQTVQAQNPEKFYSICSFIKVKPGMGPDYLKLEKAWKKIHLIRMERGEINGWALYRVPNAGTNSEYNVVAVTFLKGTKQLALFYGDYEYERENYIKGLTPEELELVQNTAKYRDLVREDVYHLRDAISSGTTGIPNIVWNTAHKLHKGVSADDFLKVEQKLVNPIVKKLIDEGAIQSFGLYERKLPSGSSAAFDLVRSFGFPDLETMLAYPEKHGAQFAQMNPNFMGTGWKIDDHEDVAVELWRKIECTCE